MATLYELLQVDYPSQQLIDDLPLHVELFLADSTPRASRPENTLIDQEFFDNGTQLDDLLVDGVHEEAELLLDLFLCR